MPAMTTPTPDTETPADLATRLLRIMSTPPDGYLLEGSGCPLHDDGGPGPAPSYWALADLRVVAYPEQPPTARGKDDKATDKIRKTLQGHLVAQDLATMKKLERSECTCLYASVNEHYFLEAIADPDGGRDDRPQPETAFKLTARGRDYAEERWPPQGRAV